MSISDSQKNDASNDIIHEESQEQSQKDITKLKEKQTISSGEVNINIENVEQKKECSLSLAIIWDSIMLQWRNMTQRYSTQKKNWRHQLISEIP